MLSGGQRAFFILFAVAVGAGFVLSPLTTGVVLVVLCVTVYLLASLYKLKLFYDSFGRRREFDFTAEEVAAIDEREVPRYTILVPLFREAAVVPRLTENLTRLDYPKSKLEILLLCEEEDDETIEAILEAGLPPYFRLLVVPDSQPKTKPKACNYGIQQATGKFVVIYDAEDQPDPDQLKKVLLAWERSEDNVVCVQSKLNYFNTEQNLLTRFFATEYALWFDLLLPGLDASGAPIPLGGTSNHFNREALVELGAWDPFNVTEDADLGLRLHKAGYRTVMLNSTTLEEANSQLQNWINQRSRWVKGYFQTYLVHMRHPIRLMREIGFGAWWSFQWIIGGTIIFVLNPIFWVLTTLWLFTRGGHHRGAVPGLRLLRGFAAAVRRQLRLHLPRGGRLDAARALPPRPLRAVQPDLLGPDVDRRVEGLLPAVHEALLLGEDRARSRYGEPLRRWSPPQPYSTAAAPTSFRSRRHRWRRRVARSRSHSR